MTGLQFTLTLPSVGNPPFLEGFKSRSQAIMANFC